MSVADIISEDIVVEVSHSILQVSKTISSAIIIVWKFFLQLSSQSGTSTVFDVMSGKDLDQCMIDLLYGYTIASNTDTLVRKKIVSEINKLMLPYIKG